MAHVTATTPTTTGAKRSSLPRHTSAPFLLILLLLVLLSLAPSVALAQTASQRRSTVAFLRKFSAALPQLQSDWTGTDFCSWPGITCDAINSATSVNLRNRSLVGTLPDFAEGDVDEYALLVSKLDLSSNPGISGTLPASWSIFPTIALIDVSYTSVTGGIPVDWQNMTALSSIRASHTNLCPTLPEWTWMPQLMSIDLSYNNLMTGSLPVSWAGDSLPNLIKANLVGSAFCGCVPTEWQQKPLLLTSLPASTTNPYMCLVTTACKPESNVCSTETTQPPSANDNSNATAVDFPVIEDQLVNTQRFLLGLASDIPQLRSAWTVADKRNVTFANAAFCDWDGIECDGALGTVMVNLAGKGLRGTCTSLASMPTVNTTMLVITSLDLSDNPSLTGTLDPQWAGIPFLVSINLANTAFTGTIPLSWGTEMRSLQVVNLNAAKACGDLPAWNTTTLLTADFTGNQLGGSLSASWAGMKQLAFLRINGNGFCGCAPDAWRSNAVLLSAVKTADEVLLDASRCNAGSHACGADSSIACRASHVVESAPLGARALDRTVALVCLGQLLLAAVIAGL